MNKYISNEKMTLEEGQKKEKENIYYSHRFSFKNHKKKNDVNKYDLEMWKK